MPALATRSRDRYRVFDAKPPVGGNLVTRGSSDNCGTFNYTVKRDFRRDLDVEVRREGHDYFWPNLTIPAAGQPFPGQITLSTIAFSAGVVTATRLGGQWFEVGESIIIAGASDPIYNGTFTITAVTATTFKYAVTGSPAANTAVGVTATPIEEINLIAMARRPNGQVATIAGSKRRLYRYYALEEGDYITRDPAAYPPGTPTDELSYWSDGTLFPADQMPPRAPGFWTPPGLAVIDMQYIDTNPGYWIVIGAGFSTSGKRWETVSMNGWMVFNNGVDLLVTYRLEDMFTVPIYELRDQGVVSVGTISEINGILMLGDLLEIRADKLDEWFNTAGWTSVDSLSYLAGVVTGTIAAGQPYAVNDPIMISGADDPAYNGQFYVTAVTPTTFKYALLGPGPATTPDISTSILTASTGNRRPYGIYTDPWANRTVYRVAWGIPELPRSWAVGYTGSIAAHTNILTLSRPSLSFSQGQKITIVGAGAPHAGGTSDNLDATIIYAVGNVITIDTIAGSSVTDAIVVRTDEISSIVGYEDLDDDGSTILKMMPLMDVLVIYKDSSVFVAQYQGIVAQPFAFSAKRIQSEQSIFYRNTLALVETPTEMFHIYAGRNRFYRFDLTNQQPMLLPRFEACSNVFYDQATLENTERIFACENGITHEINFVFPSTSDDKSMCYDYVQDTVAQGGFAFTAGATIRKPLAGTASGAEEDWFVMGTERGSVLMYGLTNINQVGRTNWSNGKQIFFRRDANPYSTTRNDYRSTIKDGLGAFGNDYDEKDLRALVLLVGSQTPSDPNTPLTTITLKVYGAQNADGPVTLIGTKVFSNIVVSNLLPIAARRLYYQSETIIDGKDNPFHRVGLIWNVAPVDSRSITRG